MNIRPQYSLSVAQAGLAVMLFCASLVATPNTPAELQAARESLNAARVTLIKAIEEFRTLRDKNGLSQTDREDFLAYIDRLKKVVEGNCLGVLKIKTELKDTTPEEGCELITSGSAGISFEQEETEDERIAALEDQLRSSISEFDELLLREMEELERKRTSAGDAGGNGNASGGQDSEGATGSDETTGSESVQQGEQQQSGSDQQGQEQAAHSTEGGQQQSGSHGGGQSTDLSGSKVKRDEPPAEGDDDIVARQLREAAENETDPVLREKLWEEYRRYKADTAAKSN